VYLTFFEVDAFLFLDLANCFGFFLSFSFGHFIMTSWALLIFFVKAFKGLIVCMGLLVAVVFVVVPVVI